MESTTQSEVRRDTLVEDAERKVKALEAEQNRLYAELFALNDRMRDARAVMVEARRAQYRYRWLSEASAAQEREDLESEWKSLPGRHTTDPRAAEL